MKLAVVLAVTMVALVSTATAAPLLCVSGGTMASYVALGSGGCIIGDKLFSNFLYGSTGRGTGVAVPASAVFLTPVGAGTNDPGPGIIFSSDGWVVPSGSPTANSFVDSSISFMVSVIGGAAIIDDGTLTLSSFAVSGVGIADITETINPAAIQLQVDSGGPLVSHKFFAPTNSVSVLKDLLVTVQQGGTGSARISSFEEDFSQIPEPAGLIPMVSGLLALGVWRRRESRRG